MLLLLIFIGCTKGFKSTFLYKGNTLVSEKKNDLFKASKIGSLIDIKGLIKDGEDMNKIDENGSTPLYIASHNGHREVVELLVNKGATIDLGNQNGSTPLYIASQHGHKEVVELLLSKGAAIDLGNETGATPIYIASRKGHKRVVELLLSKMAGINLMTKNGSTPLFIASQNGHKEIVELLLTKGAAIDLGDKNKITPLHIASLNGHKRVVELLLTKVMAIDSAEKSTALTRPLFAASQNGHKEIVELLLINGAVTDLVINDRETPLYIASQNGHIEIVRLLLRKGANVNKIRSTGESIITTALDQFKIEIVEELISTCFIEGRGIVLSSDSLRVDENILNSFQRIIASGDAIIKSRPKFHLQHKLVLKLPKIYRVLNEIYIEQFVQAFESDWKKSSSGEFLEIIDKIRVLKEINKGELESIDSIMKDVSKRSRYEIIDFLDKLFDTRKILKENPIYDEFRNNREVVLNRRVKAEYYKDYTILMLEILKGNLDKVLDKVKDFIKQGSDVNASDQNGNNCLALAIKKNLKEVIEELITNGADINAVNKSSENALMIAIEANFVDVVKILAPKTKTDHEDIFTSTALILAIKKGMYINSKSINSEKRFKDIEEIIDILLKNGSKVTEERVSLLFKDREEDEAIERFKSRLMSNLFNK